MATTRTPVPRIRPVGAAVSCDVGRTDLPLTFWYSRSSNTARSFLKPVVLTLARLCETTRHARLLRIESGLGGP